MNFSRECKECEKTFFIKKTRFPDITNKQKFCSDNCKRIYSNRVRNKYQQEIKEIRRERGLCVICGHKNESLKFRTCYKCRRRGRIINYKKRRIKS